MAMPVKLVLRGTSSISLNDRFARLPPAVTAIGNNALQHQASAKNRRLAQQMANRPSVVQALSPQVPNRSRGRGGNPMRSRLTIRGGQQRGSSVRGRLGLPARGGGFQSNRPAITAARGRWARGRAGRGVFVRGGVQRGFITRGGFNPRGGRGNIRPNASGDFRGSFKQRGRGTRNPQQFGSNNLSRANQGQRGRGRGQRGRGRGQGGRGRGQPVNKERLDEELDSYMAQTGN